MEQFVTLRSGRKLGRTVAEYDSTRQHIGKRKLRSVCYAPFLNMDFDATGTLSLCNHSHVPVAEISPETSLIEIWRGEVYRRYRRDMSNYILDDDNCRHCVRQCQAASGQHVFATEQFDAWANDDAEPLYPKRLIFRLKNTCNLACIMCDGLTSSRIRRDRDKLPPTPSAYGERFFKEMEEILPHVEHVEFYGGEPFLVKEHIRIFEILARVNPKCTIYVNTNGVSLYPKAKQYLEELNFKTIAISMDAVSDELHSQIRFGLRNDLFHRNLEYFLDLRERKGIYVMLNVTEHRKNWFELPEIFHFAERKQLRLHINTCIHPHNITLYTLPSEQLLYVVDFLEQHRVELRRTHRRLMNLDSYDFLLDLIRGELNSRGPEWKPVISDRNEESDGLLGSPLPGLPPFETAEKVSSEAKRIVNMLDSNTAARMLAEMSERVRTISPNSEWTSLSRELGELITALPHWQSQTAIQ
jgi:sulfatase maturation enzyme AslB (radical SAM superfamily)